MIADPIPLLGLAGLILVKEAGVPVPVPGDLVVVGAGVAASRGDLDPAVALAALIMASVVGEPVLAIVGGALVRFAALGVVLAVIGAVGWSVLARRRRSRDEAASVGGGVLAWTDACSPACLTLAVAGR